MWNSQSLLPNVRRWVHSLHNLDPYVLNVWILVLNLLNVLNLPYSLYTNGLYREQNAQFSRIFQLYKEHEVETCTSNNPWKKEATYEATTVVMWRACNLYYIWSSVHSCPRYTKGWPSNLQYKLRPNISHVRFATHQP